MKLMLIFFLLFGGPVFSNSNYKEVVSVQNPALFIEGLKGENVCRLFLEQFYTVSYTDASNTMEQLENEMQKTIDDIKQEDYPQEGAYTAELQLDTIETIMQEKPFENFTELAKENFVMNRAITRLYRYVLEQKSDFSVQAVELKYFYIDTEQQGYNYDVTVLIGNEQTNFTGRIQAEKEMENWKISSFEMKI